MGQWLGLLLPGVWYRVALGFQAAGRPDLGPRAWETPPCAWLLFPQVWGWPQVPLQEVHLLFQLFPCHLPGPTSFCLLREINVISLISTGTAAQEGETQNRLNSFRQKCSKWRLGKMGRRDTQKTSGRSETFAGKVIVSHIPVSEPDTQRCRSCLP